MTGMLQEGKFGRFEHSFRDIDEEVRLMAASAASLADEGAGAKPTLLGRLFGRSGAARQVLQ